MNMLPFKWKSEIIYPRDFQIKIIAYTVFQRGSSGSLPEWGAPCHP